MPSNLVAPLLAEFHQRHPDVMVELLLSHRVVDLVGAEIDLALRLGPLPDSTMAARRLARFPSRVDATESLWETTW